jgi:hypothetical protein
VDFLRYLLLNSEEIHIERKNNYGEYLE